MQRLFYSLLIAGVVWCGMALSLYATHNRAGEITYVSSPLPGQPYRYVFTINTYTKFGEADSDAADRDSLDINFGDGSPIEKAPRVNGQGTPIETGVKRNVYRIAHTYPSPFTYVVSMQDPNRIADIINIQLGNSINIPFYIQDTIYFRDPQFFGYNSSPLLYQPPIDYANVGEVFIHNPNAFDPDGDSLHFELIAPLSDRNTPVPIYQYPDEIQPGAANVLTLDPNTGELVWNTPRKKGIYNIAYLITEYRNGIKMSNMIRDMQIIVEDINNRPPDIPPIKDTCLIIGNTLEIEVTATDPDNPQQVLNLTAYGGALELDDSPATFTSNNNLGEVEGIFTWNTTCDHIYSQFYTVVFKAQDNFSTPLVDLETWRIRLLAPPPNPPTATTVGNAIQLNWSNEYVCINSPKFRGFSLWRRSGCDSIIFDHCQEGLSGTEYIKIAENLTTNTYTDNTVLRGIKYSYRLVAEFADNFTASNPPTPINVSESMPSDNVCAELPKNAPIITNVSITETATSAGKIYVAWSKPRAIPLDTIVNPPPYRYELHRAMGIDGTDFSLIQTFTANSFATANDTTYIDTNTDLNTLVNAYTYRIDFYANNQFIDKTETASSPYLSIAPADNQLTLSWQYAVPWLNYQYRIYRQNNQTTDFDFIGQTNQNSYTDTELKNGVNYCYYISTIGTYSTDDLVDPIINDSQIACSSPRDTEPPCPPTLINLTNNCNEEDPDPNAPLQNNLVWERPPLSCGNDVVGYFVYVRPPLASDFGVIDTVEGADLTAYIHNIQGSLTACYAIAAVDSFSNVSVLSNIICSENCPLYELPNAFTPNADDQNDFFIPRKSRFVNSVDFKVFNRWGGLVFNTQNPALNWDGTDSTTGNTLPEGVYYYTCEVIELTAAGSPQTAASLSGYIQLLR